MIDQKFESLFIVSSTCPLSAGGKQNSQKLLLMGMTILVLNGGRLHFRGKEFCYGVPNHKSYLVSNNHILNKTDFLRSYVFLGDKWHEFMKNVDNIDMFLIQHFIFLMLKLFETSGLKLIKSRIRII